MWRKLSILILLSVVTHPGRSQDHLQHQVSVDFKDVPVNQALVQLSDLTRAQLAFNPDVLPQKKVTASYHNADLHSVLKDILGSNYQYKVRGSYVIILPQDIKENKKVAVQISGSVRDAETGKQLADVSVYEINKLTATLSTGSGHYDITSSSYGDQTFFMVSKKNYRDTVIAVDPSGDGFFEVLLKPVKNTFSSKKNARLDSLGIFNFLVKKKVKRHMQNVDLQEHRWIQLSLVPAIGTNGFLGGEVSNNLSLNLLGGYAYGLQGLELGGAFNMEKDDVRGVQMAGLLNMVGGKTGGAQLSGGANLVLDDQSGLQMSGLANVTQGIFVGAQLSGAYNQAKDVKGLQMSGAVNLSHELAGLQMSGAANVAAEDVRGIQMSGVFNRSGRLTGLQVSGAINYATELRGIQFGVINIAQKVDKGVMIGMVNITKDGLLAGELEYNDVTDYNVSFRSGPRYLHTVLTAGVSLSKDLMSYGMGLGSEIYLTEKLFTGLELSSHTLLPLQDKPTWLPADNRFNLSLGYSLTKRIALYGGPVLHFLYYDNSAENASSFLDTIGQKPLWDDSDSDAIRKWWIGYRVAVRL